MRPSACTIGVLLLTAPITLAQSPSPSQPPLDQLSQALRNVLVQSLPPVLHERSHNWDNKNLAVRVHDWRVVKVPKNDGTWWKVKVTPGIPGDIQVHLGNLRALDQERLAFGLFLALPTNVEYETQVWESGVRLYAGSARARMRILLRLDVETLMRLDYKGGLLPDMVVRLQVVRSDVRYDNMVVEHIAGVGGTAARWIGEAARSSLKQWKPSLERDLLTRANAAVVKAGDTREVRLGLGQLLK